MKSYATSMATICISTAQKKLPESLLPGLALPLISAFRTKGTEMQEQLNAIAQSYPALPKIAVDGIYGEDTQNAVREFQKVFGLPVTGVVDYPTWYEIQEIYVGVTRIAELV